ncbi:hypothetical protein CGGC5_v006052 [Colletotrichum fructicola Nara gc5]|uniref:Uncharacterized protein n=1 Tax=Colletotrichum fructicola (strain Nara gc5) TaxID=1213859 RepID=A0A7J6JBW5_COLFN|nr:hypothetical protein CGGC5_v006052 [Colletotrichum fructicola Nara gc5]
MHPLKGVYCSARHLESRPNTTRLADCVDEPSAPARASQIITDGEAAATRYDREASPMAHRTNSPLDKFSLGKLQD